MPKVIIIAHSQVEHICRQALEFANSCQSDFSFYLIPQVDLNDTPFDGPSVEVLDALKYLDCVKKMYKYDQQDLILSFYNGLLNASNQGLSNLFCAGSRYNEQYPSTGVISLKYLGWNVLEEKYNYEVQKHSILHLILCGIIGSYTDLTPHDDIGCLLDLNIKLTSFNLKLSRGYYLCSKEEYNCYSRVKDSKYGNSIIRLCENFKKSDYKTQVNETILDDKIQIGDVRNNKGTIVDKGKIELNNAPNQNSTKKKIKLEFIHYFTIISTFCAVFVLFFGNNIWDRIVSRKANHVITNTKLHPNEKIHDTIIANLELPYLDNVPIIDKGLFLKYYYNDFVLGGINLDTISIGARATNGEGLQLVKSEGQVHMDITQEPYVEFEYKGIYYSIEITGKHYSFSCVLRQRINPTLILKKI